VASLFENIGTVKDGIATISKPQVVDDAPQARPLQVEKGQILFDQIRFYYGGAKAWMLMLVSGG